jgi:hypothetical protein
VLGANLSSLEVAGMVIGVREGVLALIVVVALYIGLVLFRMLRLANKAAEQPPAVMTDVPEKKTLPADKTEAAPVINSATEPRLEEVEPVKLESPPPGLANELLYEGMERELVQLRDEVEVMRGELSALREDMQHALAHLRATQTVSPIYGDAMQMAVAGYDAVMIAERCGIARAEAELVVALARSQVQ